LHPAWLSSLSTVFADKGEENSVCSTLPYEEYDLPITYRRHGGYAIADIYMVMYQDLKQILN
jgi:hypothetical protein